MGTSTPELTLRYNAIRPGIEDRTPGDYAHSELQLILPQDVIDEGIDADRAKQGVQVCFAYPYCRAYDEIRLNCNGKDVLRTITAAEAPATPSAEPTTICVMVGEDVFQQAGDNPKFVFSYTVTDQLGNGPDTDSPYSGTVEVDVHLRETRLVAPDLAEDPDDPSDDPSTIDLMKLGSKDLTVLVHTFAPLWQPNDKIRVTYTATKPDVPVVSHTVEADVGRIPFTYKLMVPNVKVIAGSVVRGKYELIRSGQIIATSKYAKADVIGDPIIELLPPFLVAPAVEPIDVLAYPDGVTVRIEYLEALTGDRARLVEVNPPAGSPQFPLVEFNSNKRVNIVLSPAFLAARHGKVIELRWNLNRNGGQAGKSDSIKMSVLKIADGDARLPSPVMPQADDDKILDLNILDGDAQVTVATWPQIATGQKVWMSCYGTKQDGNTLIIPLYTAWAIVESEASDGLNKSIPYEQLKLLTNASELRIELAVTLNKNTEESTATKFPPALYYISAKAVSEDFENWPLATISNPGQFIEGVSMKIFHSSGNGTISIIKRQYGTGEKSLFLLNTGAATLVSNLQLKHAYSQISFLAGEVQFTGSWVKGYNEQNNIVAQQALPVTHPNPPLRIALMKSGEKISRLEFSVTGNRGEGIALDEFIFDV
jgi:hypothetical protein